MDDGELKNGDAVARCIAAAAAAPCAHGWLLCPAQGPAVAHLLSTLLCTHSLMRTMHTMLAKQLAIERPVEMAVAGPRLTAARFCRRRCTAAVVAVQHCDGVATAVSSSLPPPEP